MSKSEGKKITIKFTEELTGDVSGMDPKPISVGDYINPVGSPTASSQYSSYAPSRAFDGSEDSYWYTRTTGTQWIQIELTEPIYVSGFRWYIGSSYRPDGFEFEGSNDGVNWDKVITSNSENITGWQEFEAAIVGPYKSYRWNITSRHSNYLYIYEIELRSASGQEGAFFVGGNQYKYVNGPLLDVEYSVEKVENHPIVENALLLTMKGFNSFNNAEGNLAVNYDATKGNLSGRGGAVESFERSFLPTGLIQTPNPNVEENIRVAPMEIVADLKDVEYVKRYGLNENISISPFEVTATLIDVEDINP